MNSFHGFIHTTQIQVLFRVCSPLIFTPILDFYLALSFSNTFALILETSTFLFLFWLSMRRLSSSCDARNSVFSSAKVRTARQHRKQKLNTLYGDSHWTSGLYKGVIETVESLERWTVLPLSTSRHNYGDSILNIEAFLTSKIQENRK